MKKQLLFSLTTLAFFATGNAQITAIPDAKFEAYLVEKNIDTDGVLNGQMATADAEALTTLSISDYSSNGEYIYDLTGIEAFVNLESLTVHSTMITELNIQALTNLRSLDCADNNLTSLDVSHNVLLTSLVVQGLGDLLPMNQISQLDLSHNHLINSILAVNVQMIDLRNGNNQPQMSIIISYDMGGVSPDDIYGHTCILIDDEDLASANSAPYNTWYILSQHRTYSLTEICGVNRKEYKANMVSVYPNPAQDVFTINTVKGETLTEASLYDITGRLVKKYDVLQNRFSVAGVQNGTYVLKVATATASHDIKLLVN